MESEQYELKKGEIVKRVNKRISDYSGYFLTYDEAKRLKEAALSYGALGTTYYVLISLMLNCGLRRVEAIKLRIEQINMQTMMLELGIDTKTRTPRKVPFNDELKRAMLPLIGNRTAGALFMHRSKNYSEKMYSTMQVNNIVANVGRKATIQPKSDGLKNVNPHLLRHSWVKFCQKAGIDRNHVRVMGGWKTMKMIDLIYGTPDYESVSVEYKAKQNW